MKAKLELGNPEMIIGVYLHVIQHSRTEGLGDFENLLSTIREIT